MGRDGATAKARGGATFGDNHRDVFVCVVLGGGGDVLKNGGGDCGGAEQGFGARRLDPRQAAFQIIPKGDDLFRRRAIGFGFHDRATINHAGRKIGAIMYGDRRDSAVLAQRNGGVAGDAGAPRG